MSLKRGANPNSKSITFMSRIIGKNREVSDLEYQENDSDIVDGIKALLEYDLKYVALEILHTLRITLKSRLETNGKLSIDRALVCLLQKKKEDFSYSKDPIIKQTFEGCSFNQLQELVKLAQFLKDELSDECESLLANSEIKESNNIEILNADSDLWIHPDLNFSVVKEVEKCSNNGFEEVFEKNKIPMIEESKTDLNWLKNDYEKHKNFLSGLSWEEFSTSLQQILSSNKSNDELQNELIEMLGFDLFELIIEILNKRHEILEAFTAESKNEPKAQHQGSTDGFENEIRNYIDIRELDEMVGKLNFSHEDLIANGFANDLKYFPKAVIITERKQILGKYRLDPNPNIHDIQQEVREKIMISGGKVSTIPQNAIIKNTAEYQELTIPPHKYEKPIQPIEKVKVENLDPIGRMVFKDIKCFNHIQSEVFNIAYNTNENMLICAPTGAGKTNVALLTIVNQAKRFISDGVVYLEKFKIVYICPMKALAAEMAMNFSKKLQCLGITVRELTGDIQMSRKEILETQMLVTTPEKWDVISRKGTADAELTSLVKLLIIDEVHLLNTDRGPVIEALVARTLRQVISSQNMIRIVGLSATLPSYYDVAHFLRVNPKVGLFYFDSRYRSVPLTQTFIGVKSRPPQSALDMDEICFNKVVSFLRDNHQVLVFVHARNQTSRTARAIIDKATSRKLTDLFIPPDKIGAKKAQWEAQKTGSKNLEEFISYGIGIHHAGMLRHDRSAMEKNFMNGSLKVLVCTATLAWGVNLPAHGVIIKGTDIYDSKKSSFVNLDILDVLQIFGRAGRPQFDTSGQGIIITHKETIEYYLKSLTNQLPIESQLLKALPDNLNAEIVLGTIANIQEAVEWLTFTYLYKRMCVSPVTYGINARQFEEDPSLRSYLLEVIHKAAEDLDKAHMIRYDKKTGELSSTYLGRTASYFYVTLETVLNFNEFFQQKRVFVNEANIVYTMCLASEFSNMKVRPEELEALDDLKDRYCLFNIQANVEDATGKVFVLMQTYLSRGYIKTLSLASDMEYINQSAVRLARALFDICIHQNDPRLAASCLKVAQAFEQRMWPQQSFLRQFKDLPLNVLETIEESRLDLQDLKDMNVQDLGHLVRNHRTASSLKHCIDSFPFVEIESTLHPITRGVLRVKLFITPNFIWNDKINGKAVENFLLWVENPETNSMYHSETCAITKAVCFKKETLELVFTVPLVEPRPPYYIVKVSSDRWMNAEHYHTLDLRTLHIPSSYTPHTELLELRPLSIKALKNPLYESLYKFSHFNPVQTQIFHCLYHRDDNVLLGAPTGSGKTIAAEICMLRLFNKQDKQKVVYIAPMKALVRERVEDWSIRFGKHLKKNVVEMTGDITPNANVIKNADLIITTPEKWDGLSRGWQNRRYVQKVGLIIIDEIHLLGEERGPVLEVIVSRINFIANQTNLKPRLVGLSTAMANAGNLANWLGIKEIGLYNFRPSVRPVPLDAHITGFPGKHYCPRMISMNRPAYQAIRQFAPYSPSLIFCSSRKQTRLTAIDLITYLLTDADSKRWLRIEEDVMERIASKVIDADLQHFLMFGIGIHHAGLQEQDRKVVEELFVNQKIQVLIATATLAWGVNFPAHLVIIKGTEYFDGKTKRYIDMPITDVLQMMGRAGRPQFDSTGVACVFVQDIKKNFYKKFLYEPFPIESNLMQVLPDHINAEIASGTITNKVKLMEYMTWTYFFRRLLENPSYYNLDNIEPNAVQQFLSDLVDAVVNRLVEYHCVTIKEEEEEMSLNYEITFYGQIASYYYLSYKTVAHFRNEIKDNSSIMELLQIMCRSEEYATFPVRHNEDKINSEIANLMQYNLNGEPCDAPHVKVGLLIHAYLTSFEFPNQEYLVDFKSVMDQALRILQAMIDIASNSSWLSCTLKLIQIVQMLIQGQYIHLPTALTLPHINTSNLAAIEKQFNKISDKPLNIINLKYTFLEIRHNLDRCFSSIFNSNVSKEIIDYIAHLPLLDFCVSIPGTKEKYSNDHPNSITLEPNKQYEFLIHFKKHGSADLNVRSLKFPKKKDEGWFVCLGDIEGDTLVQIKRVTIVRQGSCSLMVDTPENPGDYVLTLFIISDSYLGLDQQYDIPLIIQKQY